MQQAIGYVRVSTAGQATEGVSLQAQRAKIESWCALNDATLVGLFEDSGLSGGRMTGRPGLAAALKATTRGRALVCYSISRLARSTSDLIGIARTLKARRADLVSLTERIDTTSASGRMVFAMLSVLAEFEADQIGERTSAAMLYKKHQGQTYGPPPFGYAAVDGRLVALPDEQAAVRDMQHQRAAGTSYAEIAAAMNARGIAGKRGGRWFRSTVRYCLDRQEGTA